jgi:hypothetical protein
MRSILDFGNSEEFRKKLMLRNLVPYSKSPYGKTPPFTYEVSPLNDYSVIDSPDYLIDTKVLADKAYVLNQYGRDGGYQLVTDVGTLKNDKTNYGEYNFSKTNLLINSLPKLNDNIVHNFYSGVNTSQDIYADAGVFINSDDYWFDTNLKKKDILYYWLNGSSSFKPSEYTAFDIFTENANTVSKLKEDSYIVRLGAEKLSGYFEDRIGRFIDKYNILTRFENAISDINDPLDVYNLITGTKPIIEPIWTITRTNNFIFGAAQLALELAGAELPFPTIVGSYFDPTISLTGKGTKGFLGGIFQQKKTGSQLFFDNTGKGQKSILFSNIEYNLYRPNYKKNSVLGGFTDLFTKNKNGYYVGSYDLDPTDVLSPQKDLPEDQFGRKVQTPVYGPSEISKLYEGESFNPKIGANGKSFTDGGSIEGGLTWVSPKYKNNAGKNVGLNGQVFGDSNTKQTTFETTETTEYDMKPRSIMYDTQKLVESQPNNGNKLKHVGNAIDQVSKVFNDGYKEITKGSRVRKYSPNVNGGTFEEYCRLFTKDTPFLTYSRLQKKDGIVSEGRQMKNSVLNKTYDLSIYPKKGNDSKKFMLSIENLAWRTSSLYLDLPECEKGPNGGRIMWFPPYDLKFSDSSTASFSPNEFLGRPEPVYTYKSTSRTGTLEFSIVVDHPSVLNVLTNRILDNQSDAEQINGILESFFSGCLKYDLYELAKIYNTMTLSELEEIQKQVQESYEIKDEVELINRTFITSKDPSTTAETGGPVVEDKSRQFDEFKSLAFYFDNDIPSIGNTKKYQDMYNDYINKSAYTKGSLKKFMELYVKNNFLGIDEFIKRANIFLEDKNAEIIIDLVGSASKPQTPEYNISLSDRRIANAQTYIKSKINYNDRLKFKVLSLGENTQVTAKTYIRGETSGTTFSVGNCSTFAEDKIYSQQAMACRRTAISSITATISAKPPKKEITPTSSDVTIKKQTKEKKISTVETKLYRNVSKKVLQKLLSECDYFQTIEETDPFLYSNLKEKLKYFNPAFHSTTPEGLNGRLTFLQQCVRPGNTIPTIKKDGVKDFKDAKNTSFGIPPILVLRVGDFFHTKIIPNTLGLTYEKLDLNPEGIGVQPMIAKVNLGFTFVGGHGLGNAIDKLQNALNFNYYANTEVYDPKADVTDESLNDTDKKILDYIKEKEKVAEENNNPDQPTNSYTTIGLIEESVSFGVIDETSGMLNYFTIAKLMKDETIAYISTISSIVEENLKRYNSDFIKYILTTVNNSIGVYLTNSSDEFSLLGIPTSYQPSLESILNEIKKAIQDGSDLFISKIKEEFKNKKEIESEVSANYIKYLDDEFGKLKEDVNSFVNSLIKAQENYQRVVSKLLFVTSTYQGAEGYDGYLDKDGNSKSYKLTMDPKPIKDLLGSAKNEIKNIINYINNGKVNPDTIKSDSKQESLIYFLFYGILKNKENLNDFKTKILLKSLSNDNVIYNNTIKTIFDEYWKSLISNYDTLKSEDESTYKTTLVSEKTKSVNVIKGIEITEDKFKYSYLFIQNPDNNIKDALFNLNSKLDYDSTNHKTWNMNKNNFILVKNKLSK